MILALLIGVTQRETILPYMYGMHFRLSSAHLTLDSYLPRGAEKQGSYLPDHFRQVSRYLEKTF